MREYTSRPNWSVPSGCGQLDASVMAAKSFEVGSKGAIQRARTAAEAITRTRIMPKAPSGSRAQNDSMIREGLRLSACSSAATARVVSKGAVLDTGSPEPDARIEPRVEHVDSQVADHEHRDHEHHQGLGKR